MIGWNHEPRNSVQRAARCPALSGIMEEGTATHQHRCHYDRNRLGQQAGAWHLRTSNLLPSIHTLWRGLGELHILHGDKVKLKATIVPSRKAEPGDLVLYLKRIDLGSYILWERHIGIYVGRIKKLTLPPRINIIGSDGTLVRTADYVKVEEFQLQWKIKSTKRAPTTHLFKPILPILVKWFLLPLPIIKIL